MAGERVLVVTATALTTPPWMFLACGGTPSTIIAMRPASRSGMAATVPR
jgi:hypothetical protein